MTLKVSNTSSKYDDRYLTLVILFTLVTLVSLFQSYIQFYRAECITVSGFLMKYMVISTNYTLWQTNSKTDYFLMHFDILKFFFSFGHTDLTNIVSNKTNHKQTSKTYKSVLDIPGQPFI